MSPITQHLITFLSLIFSALMGIGAILVLFKRAKPLAEEIKETLAQYARREELEHLKQDMQRQCSDRHAHVDSSFKELFKLDRQRTKEITNRLDTININLSGWQQTTESKLGNHDGRIQNLERSQ